MNVNWVLGEELKARRLALGLSRQEAYKKFRVSPAFIAALEDGRIDDLPSPIYARGFIKTYCEALGLVPDSVLHAYEDALAKPPGGFSLRRTTGRAHRPAWLDDALMWAAIVGVVLAAWLAYTAVVRPGASHDALQVQAETVELPVDDPFAAP